MEAGPFIFVKGSPISTEIVQKIRTFHRLSVTPSTCGPHWDISCRYSVFIVSIETYKRYRQRLTMAYGRRRTMLPLVAPSYSMGVFTMTIHT